MVTHMDTLPDPPPARQRRPPLPPAAEVVEPFHRAPSVSADGNVFPDYVDANPGPRSAVDRAIELGVKLREAKDMIEKIDAARGFSEDLDRIDQARAKWLRDPEDIAAGVEFARRIASTISRLEHFVPETMPWPFPEMIKGPFKAVPAYVEAIGGHLQQRVQAIDDAFEKSGDVVRYEKNGPSCQGGRVDAAGVQLIKSLHEDDYVKRNVFRAACHNGINSAIQQYVAGRLDYVE